MADTESRPLPVKEGVFTVLPKLVFIFVVDVTLGMKGTPACGDWKSAARALALSILANVALCIKRKDTAEFVLPRQAKKYNSSETENFHHFLVINSVCIFWYAIKLLFLQICSCLKKHNPKNLNE